MIGIQARYVRAWVATLLVLGAGCDRVFSLDEPPDVNPDALPYDRCGAFLFDEPLRYAAVANPKSTLDPDGNPVPAPWSWDEARARCQQLGMDLAVFNNESELGRAAVPDAWPYWIGQQLDGTAWKAVDGCPALNPLVSEGAGCGIVSAPTEIAASDCAGTLPATFESKVVLGALCETPRPNDTRCLGRNPRTQRYVMSPETMSFEAARGFCGRMDAQLVVFESHDEWLHISKLVNESFEKPFWTGSRFGGTTWITENGCPGMYTWVNGTPGPLAPGMCAGTAVRVTEDPEHAGAWLEGVTPTDCTVTSQLYALCELD